MKNKKIYIEAGAHDGYFQSRSLQFKDNPEYFGILIEPSPDTFLHCLLSRGNDLCKVYNYALVSNDFIGNEITMGVHQIYSAMNSIVKPESESFPNSITVKARTLQSILDELDISLVEHLFLDAEGYEFEIINGIDFDKTSFSNIEIECHYNFLNISYEEEVEKHETFLKNKGYILKNILTDDGHPKLIFNKI